MYLRNLLAVFLVFFLVGCEQPKLPSPFHASDVTAMFEKVDFRLNDHTGKPRTLEEFRGKVVLLFFGYTHCPDVCPTTLADMARMMQLLGSDADKVQVLFVTVDPERDTPELLAKYVPHFHPSFIGLYGDAQATEQAATAFRAMYKKQPAASGYTMDHTSGTYLMDIYGRVRLSAPYGQSAEWLADDVRLLLASRR